MVFKRQVGKAFGKGAKAAFHDDFLPLGITVFVVGNGNFIEGVMQRKPRSGATFNMETLGRICAETIGLLSIQKTEGANDCEEGKYAFHSLKSLFHAAKIQIKTE